MMDDYMELGNSGMRPIANGWFEDITTGNKMDPQGRVFNAAGEQIWDPDIEEDDDEYRQS